ncbi:disease resistance protein RUN1 isoform X1 [Gossypium hirsutum]|uniref:Disease resistance protein RUN1 isoform X1 n=1 Tax=Gossypium hirsutum TaxID=3635 RepID=A0ABM2YWP2_GOSHI|nr:disease resistance protein RUN1-like isoform X1 [Gossypium hirsutum]XP_040934080.1 disease resistance protein RUN1-like isoform X1 [Gossypium hirsutum]XP_040934081.1 disease resistance protein RUN1-like isoform X1 [Gossypium hirsutum]XP_040934082.1 disease resistance protein RUN1-like isoform X1 [Gossypium hirsutum]
MAASSSSSSPQRDTCLNFITYLLETLKHRIMNIFFHEQDLEDEEQLSQALPQTIVSSYSSRQLKHQVFLSFRGEDTRLNFTAHLLKALKDTGMNVFFDEEKLEKGEQLSSALSQAIAASNLSIIVLSVDSASSKSCLAEVSDIMDRKDTQGHIVLPIFYHVDPSNVRNIGGSFKTSFEDHELKRPIDEVKRWKSAFVEVGKLKGWHIIGGKFDRPETEYIKDIVEYVIKKLMNNYFRNASEELVGIDDQKKMILGLIEQEDTRIIGLWGMGGIGKTTLADVVYKEVSQKFDDSCFLHNVSQKIEKQGMESLRDDFLTELLKQEIHIRTPSIGQDFIQERLNNKKVIVVLDDVNDSDLMNDLGVQYFGEGSKIIITSRDKQVLKNGEANKIHEVLKLNENDSLQLFSIFAFRQLNPAVDFLNLSYKFVR